MADYQTGDIIRVTNDAVEVLRTQQDPALGLVVVAVKRMKDGSRREGSVFVDAPDTVVEIVERAAPAWWPPRQRDLWRDRTGELWFAVDVSDPDETPLPEIKFVPSFDADQYNPDKIRKDRGPLSLVHRDGGE